MINPGAIAALTSALLVTLALKKDKESLKYPNSSSEDFTFLLILTAISLFNQKGYNKVSLREICEASWTTIGNLTYHFKRKEDLIEGIIVDLHDDYDFYFNEKLEPEKMLNNLIFSFHQEDKKYFFILYL